jgi:hypothetical protein
MAPNPIITPQSPTATVTYDAGNDDKALFAIAGNALAGVETVTFYVATSASGTTPIYDASGAAVQLTASLQSVMLEGGMRYVLVKSVTASTTGVDVTSKPRIGPH